MSAKAVMVLGTTSGAGKSWLTTALCRWYARQGLKVAPFKAQNMSNNARVVPGLRGQAGEIGSAQYFQALAAGVPPDVRMNPVLLKPEHETASQVIVLGEVRNDLRDMPWRQRSEALWPFARQGLDALRAESDLVLIEGAGSPAEINLHSSDFVNMRTAVHARAACLLVTDIDRGGAFAHLYGTHQLLPPEERALIQGFVLNRFRGDAGLLAPGPEQLQALTGVPTVGVLPMWRGHGLPEEDGVFDDAPSGGIFPVANQALTRVAVIAYPRLSNLDEFQPLRSAQGVRLVWARHPNDLDDADWLILPGSKHTRADLNWLRDQGLADAIVQHARQGRAVLGVCGGLQMLGEWLCDPDGIEGQATERVRGLGLLPLQTTFDACKLLRDTTATFAPLGEEAGPWESLGGVTARGYEIHHGRTEVLPDVVALRPASQFLPVSLPLRAILHDAQGQPLGWQQGCVMGCYLHGLFEDAAVMQALLGVQSPSLPRVMDGLADFIDRHMQVSALWRLLDR